MELIRQHKFLTALFVLCCFYAVFVFAYIIKPAYSTDLIRYFEILNSVKNLSLRESIELMDDGLLVENFLFWIV